MELVVLNFHWKHLEGLGCWCLIRKKKFILFRGDLSSIRDYHYSSSVVKMLNRGFLNKDMEWTNLLVLSWPGGPLRPRRPRCSRRRRRISASLAGRLLREHKRPGPRPGSYVGRNLPPHGSYVLATSRRRLPRQQLPVARFPRCSAHLSSGPVRTGTT